MFTEADKLCGRLYQKLNSILGHKVVMDHMPLLMVCLEVCTCIPCVDIYIFLIFFISIFFLLILSLIHYTYII